MNNFLFAVGCNKYQNYSNLSAAEKDAERIYEALAIGPYSCYTNKSIKLLSPLYNDFRSALLESLEHLSEEDVFCFYFAGHGGVYKGSYYLCLNDTKKPNAAFNGVCLSDLFNLVNASSARHIYIILDSCQSSGLVNDFNNLIKSEIVGQNNSKSFAILAASASNQSAGETSEGGLLTTHLLECLNGSCLINDTRKNLDLVEIGRYISNIFINKRFNQIPTSWGLNLYGESQFALNPFYSESSDERSIYQVIPARSAIGVKISQYAKEIRSLQFSLEVEVSPMDICILLNKIRSECFSQDDEYINFLLGISVPLIEQAQKSPDLFGASIAISALFPTLLSIDLSLRDIAIAHFLKVHFELSKDEFNKFHERLRTDKYSLVTTGKGGDIIGDFYCLPIRISKTLSWLTLFWTESIIFSEQIYLESISRVISSLLDDYPTGFCAISESQAAHIYYTLTFLTTNSCSYIAWQLYIQYFESLINRRGEVIDFDEEWDELASYFLSDLNRNEECSEKLFANPSSLLSMLFLFARRLSLENEVDNHMHIFDRKAIYFYICSNHTEFGFRRMQNGFNFGQVVGHSFWTIEEFLKEIESHVLPHLKKDQALTNPFVRIASTISSLIFEDRLPLFLELYPPQYA